MPEKCMKVSLGYAWYDMTVLFMNDSLTFTFYETFSRSIPNWTTFVKEVFNMILSLESDKMTALWLNESLTWTIFVKIMIRLPNWTNFVNKVSRFDQ